METHMMDSKDAHELESGWTYEPSAHVFQASNSNTGNLE